MVARSLMVLFIAVVVSIAVVPAAHADSIAALEWTGGNYSATELDDFTIGYEFTVTGTVTVTDLGVYDHGGNGLDGATDVGIWDDDGTLLATVTVGAGTSGELDGHFRYASITDLDLDTGTYHVAALFSSEDDAMAYGVATMSTASGITWVQDRFVESTSGLAFPTETDGVYNGYFGGNLRIAAVPEPGTLALFGMSAAGLALVRRRRRNA